MVVVVHQCRFQFVSSVNYDGAPVNVDYEASPNINHGGAPNVDHGAASNINHGETVSHNRASFI